MSCFLHYSQLSIYVFGQISIHLHASQNPYRLWLSDSTPFSVFELIKQRIIGRQVIELHSLVKCSIRVGSLVAFGSVSHVTVPPTSSFSLPKGNRNKLIVLMNAVSNMFMDVPKKCHMPDWFSRTVMNLKMMMIKSETRNERPRGNRCIKEKREFSYSPVMGLIK